MRLAYADPHPVPGLTPSTLQILQTVDGLGQAGVDVTLITPQSPLPAEQVLGHALSPNVRLRPCFDPRKRWYFPFSSHKPFFWRAKRLLAKGGFDALLVRNLKLARYLLERCPDLPLFFETHEIFAQTFLEERQPLGRRDQGKYQRLLDNERAVYTGALGIFPLTSLLAEDIARDYGTGQGRFCVLPDGFDPALAAAASRRLAEQGRQPGPPRILYLGSLHPWKGVATLVEAMADVPAPIECWIAGGEAERIAELKARGDALGLGQRLRFLGKVPPAERFDLIAQADVCALPLTETSIASRYTSPLKLFEYMAMRKPLLVADLPSIREVWSAPEGRFAVGDAADCARQIRRLFSLIDTGAVAGLYADIDPDAYAWRRRGERIQTMIRASLPVRSRL